MNKKNWILSVLAFIAISFSFAGCGGGGSSSNPAAAPLSSSALANLSGTVTFDNAPLANAKVFLYKSDTAYLAGMAQAGSRRANMIGQTLQQEGSYSTFSDENGFYEFSGVPVGEYTLIAAKDQTHQFARTNVMLGAVSQVDAQLTPTGSVTGQVQLNTTTGGENVSGAIVYLVGTSYVAVTDIDGTFTIENVPANQSFELDVISPRGESTTNPTVTVSPGTSAEAGIITLESPTVPTATIAGNISMSGVTAPDPELFGHLILLSANGTPPLINVTDENGNFSFLVKREGLFRVTPIPDEFDSTPIYQNVTTTFGKTSNLQEPFVLDMDIEEPRYMVSGAIFKVEKAFDGEDESGVPIMLTSTADSNINYVAVSAPDGAFAVDVASGEYQISVGGGYRFQAPLASNPITVNSDIALPSPINLVPGKGMIQVHGTVNKLAYAFNETDDAGVPLTLTSTDTTAETYAAVTDNFGNFSFYVPPGEYNLAVGGGYKFAADFTANPLTIDPGFSFTNVIELLPTREKLFKVSGTLNKTVFTYGKADHRDISVFLEEQGLVLDTFSTITDPAGDFVFYVPVGTYTLQIGGVYEFVTSPGPASVDGDFNFGTLEVSPIDTVGGSVAGTILPSSVSESYELRIESVPAGDFVDMEAAQPGTGNYSFDMLPPGDYRILVLPQKNGYYAVSPQFTVTAGQHQTLPDINATLVKPTIDVVSLPISDGLRVTGTNFLSYPNTADTALLVDGLKMPRPPAYTLSDTEDVASITEIAPGRHQVMLRKRFASGSVDVFLSSNLLEFTKPIEAPDNPQIEKITDTSVSFTWENAPYAEQTEIEILEYPAMITVGSVDLVSGTRYERGGLTPDTQYEIHLKSVVGSLKSTHYAVSFTTRKTENYGIDSVQLTYGLTSADIFGFEVVNDNYYVAAYASSTGQISVIQFDSIGAQVNNTTFTAISYFPLKSCSFAASSNNLYVQFIDGSEASVIRSLNLDLSPGGVGSDPWPYSFEEAQLIFANNKLYSLSTNFINGSNTSLYEFSSPNTDLTASSTIINQYSIAGNGFIGGSPKKAVVTEINDSLIVGIASAPDTLNYNTEVLVTRYPFANMNAPQPLGPYTVEVGASGSDIGFNDFANINGHIYLSLSSGFYNREVFRLEPFTGYLSPISAMVKRQNFATDGQGRFWAGEDSFGQKFYVQLSPDGTTAEKSLKVSSFPVNDSLELPYMSEYLKNDLVTGSFNMLYFDASGNLAVYNYLASY